MSIFSQGALELTFSVLFELNYSTSLWLIVSQLLVALMSIKSMRLMLKDMGKIKSDDIPLVYDQEKSADKNFIIFALIISTSGLYFGIDYWFYTIAFSVIYTLFVQKFQGYV